MKKFTRISALLMVFTVLIVMAVPVFAEGEAVAVGEAAAAAAASGVMGKGLGAGIAVGIAAGLGALGMGIATGRASEAMARQPEIKGDIRTTLILGIVFMETAIIYALIVAVLVIFVM